MDGTQTDNAAIIRKSAAARNKKIVRTSVIGILANVFLAAFKAAAGIISNSIAITLDAVNNLSDAASSVITIVGTKLAGKQPDKKHPFGHGRIEYLSAMLISFIILYAGVTSLIESIKKIISPETADYSPVILIVVAVAVAVKIVLGTYVKKVGKKVNSASLINSGEDARLDSIISASTLVAAAIYLIWGVSLEAYLAAVISLVIIKSGVDMLRSTLSKILGEAADGELVKSIKETVCSFPDVSGAYDLVLHNYGPDTFTGSLHIGIPDTYSAGSLDGLIHEITMEVYKKHNVYLTAVGIYPDNTKNEDMMQMRDKIEKAVLEDKDVYEMHGFYVFEEKKLIRVDLVITLSAKDRQKTFEEAKAKIKAMYPDYEVLAVMDTDYSE